MTTNYVARELRNTGKSDAIDTILDVLANPNISAPEKWTSINAVLPAGVADYVLLAFAAGREFESAQIEKKIAAIF